MRAGSFKPRRGAPSASRSSTPDETSTAHGMHVGDRRARRCRRRVRRKESAARPAPHVSPRVRRPQSNAWPVPPGRSPSRNASNSSAAASSYGDTDSSKSTPSFTGIALTYRRPKARQKSAGSVAVELQHVERHGGERRSHRRRLGIDEERHDGHERRQRGDDRARLRVRDDPRRARPEDEPDRVGARARGGERVGDARDAADLDAGAAGWRVVAHVRGQITRIGWASCGRGNVAPRRRQREAGIVIGADEVEAVGRERRRRRACDRRRAAARRSTTATFARADLHQRADDVAHHVMEECVGA